MEFMTENLFFWCILRSLREFVWNIILFFSFNFLQSCFWGCVLERLDTSKLINNLTFNMNKENNLCNTPNGSFRTSFLQNQKRDSSSITLDFGSSTSLRTQILVVNQLRVLTNGFKNQAGLLFFWFWGRI